MWGNVIRSSWIKTIKGSLRLFLFHCYLLSLPLQLLEYFSAFKQTHFLRSTLGAFTKKNLEVQLKIYYRILRQILGTQYVESQELMRGNEISEIYLDIVTNPYLFSANYEF